MQDFGIQAIISMLVHLIFFMITWWALQSIKFDGLLRAGKVIQARVLYILVTIAIGASVSRFFLDYLFWSQQLPFIFGVNLML